MIIGVLRERKLGEHRVGLTPLGASQLIQAGHAVLVEKSAGVGSGFEDTHYKDSGAQICSKPKEVVSLADMIVKIKEPTEKEYYLLRMMHGKILFAYLHLAGVPQTLTKMLLKHKVTGLAYETIEDKDWLLPLLAPMSEVAGVAAIQFATEYLQKKHGGCGITLGKIRDVEAARVVIVGGGAAGVSAARIAEGMGAQVTILEKRAARVADLKKMFQEKSISVVNTNSCDTAGYLRGAHVLIGATLHSGARAEHAISREQVLLTAQGAVIVDISIDQGGCIWGSQGTTHEKPTFMKEGRVYCCVTNIPGQFPLQSTPALTNKTLPYILMIARGGIEQALLKDQRFAKGLNTWQGYITNQVVAENLCMEKSYKNPYELVEESLRKRIVA